MRTRKRPYYPVNDRNHTNKVVQKEERGGRGGRKDRKEERRRKEDNDDDDGSSRVPFIEKLSTKEKNATSFMKSKPSLANE